MWIYKTEENERSTIAKKPKCKIQLQKFYNVDAANFSPLTYKSFILLQTQIKYNILMS